MDSNWIISAVSARLVSSLTLILIFAYMGARFREPFLKWWLWAWIFNAVKFALFLTGLSLGRPPLLFAAENLITLAGSVAILRGTEMLLGRPWGKYWPLAGACLAAWIAAAPLAGASRAGVEYPLYFYAGFLHILAGVTFLRQERLMGLAGRLTGWALIAWGLHQMDYPLLRPLGIFAPWGFVIAAALSTLAGVGQLLWYFELTRERLRVSEGRYRELFDVAPVGIMLLEEGRGVLEINAKGLEMFGARVRDMVGARPDSFIHPDDLKALPDRAVRDNLGPGQATRLTRRYRRAGGGYFSAEVDVLRLGRENRFLVIFEDVTRALDDRERLAQSEERFRTLVGNIPGAVYRCANNQSWTVAYASDGVEELTGYPASDFTGRGTRCFADVIAPEDREMVWETVQHAVKRGSVYDLEYRILHKDGRVPWVHERGRGVRGASGELLWLDGVIQNATERKNAEDSLRKALAFNQMLMRHAPVGLSVYDGETGQCVAANDVLGDLLGDRDGHLTPRGFRDYPVWRETSLAATAEEALSGLGMRRKDVRVKDPDGREAVLECVFARFDVDGKPYLLRVAQDISSRVRMEEVMIQTEKMMSVGGLAAGMAHEINNPLGGILQASQVVLARLSDDSPVNRKAAEEAGCSIENLHAFVKKREVATLLEHIRGSAKRAAKIVAGMLEFSRPSGSAPAEEDLRAVLDRAVELCQSDYDLKKHYDFRHIRIERRYEENLPPVRCSRTQIEQVFMNILRNSAQAMHARPAEGLPPVITLRASTENGFVRVEIADNGPGMDKPTRRRIFEPFFTTKGPGEGTGLGLSVSYFIVTSNHAGHIEVDSEPGRGTAFIIRLPLAASDARGQ